jgi:hypothetical protein
MNRIEIKAELKARRWAMERRLQTLLLLLLLLLVPGQTHGAPADVRLRAGDATTAPQSPSPPAESASQPLRVFYSERLWDNAVVATQSAAQALKKQGYQDVTARFPAGLDGYVAAAPFEGSVPLVTFVGTHGQHRDSMTVASAAGFADAKAKRYTRSTDVVGYVWPDQQCCSTYLGADVDCVALSTWLCTGPNGEQDHILATDAWSVADTLSSANYTRVRTEGFAAASWPLPARPLPLPPALTTTALVMFYSEQHKDSLVVSEAAGMDYAAGLSVDGYVRQTSDVDQGRVFGSQWSPELLPLRLFHNADSHHHILGASEGAATWAHEHGYSAVPNSTQGWVWPWSVSVEEGSPLVRDGTAPLQHFYSSRSGDVMLVGKRSTMQTTRADGEGTCSSSWHNSSCGYSFQRIDSLYPTQRWYEWPRPADGNGSTTVDGVPHDCPLKRSELFNRILFSDRVSNYAMTAADTWYPSWGADDLLYSIFTDGEVGFYSRGSELIRDQLPMNRSNNDRELSMPSSVFCCSSCMQSEANTGSAILQGSDPFGMTVQALGCSPASHGRHFRGRYPSANLHHNGTWYAGTYALNDGNRVLGPFVGFRTSRTRGESWVQEPALTPTSSIFEEEKFGGGVIRIGAPHFVDFGRDMEHSPDGRAYMVSQWGRSELPTLSFRLDCRVCGVLDANAKHAVG